MSYIFRKGRPTNLKLGTETGHDDLHHRQTCAMMTSKVRGHVICLTRVCLKGTLRIFLLGSRPKAERGGRVLGEGAATPSPPVKGSGERCEFPSGVRGSPDYPKVIHYFQHSGWPLLTL